MGVGGIEDEVWRVRMEARSRGGSVDQWSKIVDPDRFKVNKISGSPDPILFQEGQNCPQRKKGKIHFLRKS